MMDKTEEYLDKKEYSKDLNVKKSHVLELLKWVANQPHLPGGITEFQVIIFLKSCNYDVDLTRATIENYFTMRTSFEDIFDLPPDREKSGFFSLLTVLRRRTPDNYVVVLSKLMDTRLEVYDSIDFWRLFNMLVLLDFAQFGSAKGLVILFDLEGTTFAHMVSSNWAQMRKVLQYLEQAAPYKLKGVHFLHMQYFAYKAVQWVKCFARGETVRMMHFHNNMDSLYKYVPKEFLPEDYGGDAPSCFSLYENGIQLFHQHLDFFRWLDSQKVDESKRPIKDQEITQNFVGRFSSFFRNKKPHTRVEK